MAFATTRDASNAVPLVDAFVYFAPVGSTLPVDVTAALDVAFKDVGWLTDTGVGEGVSTGTNVRRGINGSQLKVIRTDDDKSFTFEAYEDNVNVLELTRPGTTAATVTGLTTANVLSYVGQNVKAFVIEYDYGTYKRRRVIPTGEAFLTGTVTAKPGDIAVKQFTLNCYPATDGEAYIDITDNPAEAVA